MYREIGSVWYKILFLLKKKISKFCFLIVFFSFYYFVPKKTIQVETLAMLGHKNLH